MTQITKVNGSKKSKSSILSKVFCNKTTKPAKKIVTTQASQTPDEKGITKTFETVGSGGCLNIILALILMALEVKSMISIRSVLIKTPLTPNSMSPRWNNPISPSKRDLLFFQPKLSTCIMSKRKFKFSRIADTMGKFP